MRHSQEAISRLVKEQRASGETVREFCAARGLNSKVFYVWRQRTRKVSAGFARVETSGARSIELELSGGVVIRVAIEDLKAVLEALR
jgi:hypothetical protein